MNEDDLEFIPLDDYIFQALHDPNFWVYDQDKKMVQPPEYELWRPLKRDEKWIVTDVVACPFGYNSNGQGIVLPNPCNELKMFTGQSMCSITVADGWYVYRLKDEKLKIHKNKSFSEPLPLP
jgi:hypothetical protein